MGRTHLLQPALLLLADDEGLELLVRDGLLRPRLEPADLHAPRHPLPWIRHLWLCDPPSIPLLLDTTLSERG